MVTRCTPAAAVADAAQAITGGLARRKPITAFRLSGLFLLRLAERTARGLLFHEPPRTAGLRLGQTPPHE